MCGLLFQKSKKEINKKTFEEALLLMKHRGQDHIGIEEYPGNMIFGHLRLSIIDLHERSNQPMINDKNSNIIIFNGEIYNYVELKKDLQSKNITFKSDGDTEVLLKALEIYGIDVIEKLNGPCSFLFYNKNENKVYISRDKWGKTPLYYYIDENDFIVSSEIKSIFYILNKKRVIRKKHIEKFVKYNFLPSHEKETLYEDIYQLCPGDIGEINLNEKEYKIKKYDLNKISNLIPEENKSSIQQVVEDSVKIRLRNDVKTAVLVSGGIDSTIVVNYAKNLSDNLVYFKCDFGKDEDDYYSDYLAKKLKINLIKVPMSQNIRTNILSEINEIIKIFEFPVPINGVTLAYNYLYKELKKNGVRCVLDGGGGDEIYGGYFDRYSRHYINECLENFQLINLTSFIYYNFKYKHTTLLGDLNCVLKKILKMIFNYGSNKSENPHLINRFKNLSEYQLFDNCFNLTPFALRLQHNSAMKNSLDVRSPFYDYRQVTFLKNRKEDKFKKGLNKYILRDLIPNNLKEIKNRVSKTPLNFGFEKDLVNNYQNEITRSIAGSEIVKEVVNNQYLKNLLNNISSNNNPHFLREILRLYSVSIFEKNFGSNIK